RHGAAASGLVLAVCGLLAAMSVHTFLTTGAAVSRSTERAQGQVVGTRGSTVEVRWSGPGGERTDTVALAVAPPPVGTRTEVAFDPERYSAVLIPGSRELADLDRAASAAAVSVLLTGGVLMVGAWHLITRSRVRRAPRRAVALRRVRFQSGLLGRSWLETESPPQRWIPVHFHPALITLPAPTSVLVHGNPQVDRLVGAVVDGVWVPPSGPVRAAEPRGRRTDNPSTPDADAHRRATGVDWRRQLRNDLVLVVPAPFIGLFWVFLDGGGVATWAGATMLVAALGLWWAALRGSDPT
ncbi:MAG: hypothetical protein M3291_13800, partial [Actinomycetota bacterium]|nr:hypothetical protein [Actinomycetota bacterium]